MTKCSHIENPQVKWKRQVGSQRVGYNRWNGEWENFFSREQKVMWWGVYSGEPQKQKREDSKQTAAVNQFNAAARQKKNKGNSESFNVFELDTSWKIGCDLITWGRKRNGERSRRCVGSPETFTRVDVPCSIPFRSSPRGVKEGDAAPFDLCSERQSMRTQSRLQLLLYVYCQTSVYCW